MILKIREYYSYFPLKIKIVILYKRVGRNTSLYIKYLEKGANY